MIDETFAPSYGSGVTVSPGTSTAAAETGKGSKSICLTNTGSVAVYVRTGDSSVEATVADYIVLPSAQVTISKAQDHTHVAHITAADTGTLNIIPGEGF
jgi:hypothetical protein